MTRVAVVTAGQLSTCPRMLKAADALAETGYDVHVVAAWSTPWAAAADETLLESRRGRWTWTVVDLRRYASPAAYLRAGVRYRVARALSRLPRPPHAVAVRAFARAHDELARAALETRADLLYGGTTGGIAATAEAARRLGAPYALDLEDFYRGQGEEDELARRVEDAVLAGAVFRTAGSEAIAEAYRREAGVDCAAVHNAFSLPAEPPRFEPREGPLRLYWFSQTVGPGRGLEEAVSALADAGVSAELAVRGNLQPGFGETLRGRASDELALRFLLPAPPAEMVRLAREHDVGLALEPGRTENNRLALGNKVLTYLAAGLAVALTDLPGHRDVLRDLGGNAVLSAAGLARFASDRSFLLACRRASWQAARRRWHWEHPRERGRLLELVREALR